MIDNREYCEILSRKLGKHKLYLTPLSGNVSTYTDWINDFEISSMLGRSNRVTTEAEQQEFINHCKGKPYFDINYIEEGSVVKIGVCSIVVIDELTRHAVIGIHIGNKKYMGIGAGKMTVDMLMEFAFKGMNIESLSLTVVEDNKKAIQCYEKCGFKRQGIQRNRAYVNGVYKDLIYMDITKEEYFILAQ